MSHPLEDSQNTLMQDLIRSHHQLPTAQLLSMLTSLSDQLASCDEEVARLHARITELTHHRAHLQEQYDRCQTLFAPVRRLPAEIIVEIFTSTADAVDHFSADIYGTAAAMHILAQSAVLAVSQVCARWHTIALNTPSLWTKISLHAALWRTPGTTAKAMVLLQLALTRSGQYPLTISVLRGTGLSTHGPALELLAQHSGRWRVATFGGLASDFRHLSGAKGNVPILETLEIAATGSEPVNVFETAPSLKNFTTVEAQGPHISIPPLNQVSKLRYLYLSSTDIAKVISATSHLSPANSFTLQFYLDDSNRTASLDLGITPTSSDVGHLAIELVGEFFKHHCMQALGAMFADLTLPHLESLAFDSETYPRFPLQWPHLHFLALSKRSAFHTHLQSLCLFHVQITEAQLLQCLVALPALTTLAIADHERVGRGVNLVLITDTLLSTLTRTPAAQCLIPHLHTLRLRSRLEFDDNVFYEFIMSRVMPGGRFECVLGMLKHWKESQGRRIGGAIVARLRELVVQGNLTMSLPWSQ
ncbi:hypothetical protein B0H12DRAFT_1181989 [Mycena haematopus]|nr:hypothetical protein B0H12DRAFT_1181989 [Mycena haematopus]